MRGVKRPRRSTLLFAAVLSVMATAGVPSYAASAPAPAPGPFGLSPTPLAGGKARGYFSIDLAAGQAATETLLVYNESPKPEELRLIRALGQTATNSGDSFQSDPSTCRSTGCWLASLPSEIRIAPHRVEEAAFKVSVPAGTPAGQYLAGVTAVSASLPKSVLLGRQGKTSERAIVIDEVTVGVAVTVGPLSKLRTQMRIPAVKGSRLEALPRVEMELANVGQTFSHATGSLACRVGTKSLRYAVTASTILPGQQAVLPINAQSIGFNKTVPCTARMAYGHNQVAIWSGLVRMPSSVQPTKTYHTGNGVYTSLPARSNGIPGWAIAVIAIGSLCLVGMGGMAFWILRRGGLRRA